MVAWVVVALSFGAILLTAKTNPAPTRKRLSLSCCRGLTRLRATVCVDKILMKLHKDSKKPEDITNYINLFVVRAWL